MLDKRGSKKSDSFPFLWYVARQSPKKEKKKKGLLQQTPARGLTPILTPIQVAHKANTGSGSAIHRMQGENFALSLRATLRDHSDGHKESKMPIKRILTLKTKAP